MNLVSLRQDHFVDTCMSPGFIDALFVFVQMAENHFPSIMALPVLKIFYRYLLNIHGFTFVLYTSNVDKM